MRYFTEKLLPKLDKGATIVNMSSGAGLGWSQNGPMLKEFLALGSIDEIDGFVSKHKIGNVGIVNNAAYPLSKQLLCVWTMKSYALWRERGIRMNAVAPAGVATPILEDFLRSFGEESAARMKAIGSASSDEIAEIAITLLDQKLGWVNGCVVPADRGAITAGALARMGL